MALKIRKNRSPEPPYACPLSTCMAVLGGAWTPNVIWNLSGGPRRFSELRHDIPKVSAKVLTARLRALEAKGVVIREVKPTRSEERRVGKECVSTCRSRGSPDH